MPRSNSAKISPSRKKAYAQAGVDIDLGDRLKAGLKDSLKKARRPEVMGTVGGFGGLFDFSRIRLKEPVLVSSVDGVGTKLRLAFASGRHEIPGEDIVNHCVNDIAVLGAEPLFFLDYIGLGKLDPEVFQKLISGMSAACAAAGCALIGGETAQMPGFYQPGEYDLVGSIVGVVEKKKILSGEAIRPGDKLIGLASTGLHTNGFSLANKVIFEQLGMRPNDKVPGGRETFLTALLRPHRNYAPLMMRLFKQYNRGASSATRASNAIYGAIHITGGGFSGNIPRVLPEDCDAEIGIHAWPKLPIFQFLADRSGVNRDELYEVFNMGIGMVLVVNAEVEQKILRDCSEAGIAAYSIGGVNPGDRQVQLRD